MTGTPTSEATPNNSVRQHIHSGEQRQSKVARILWQLARLINLRRRRKAASFLISLVCRLEGGALFSSTARQILVEWYDIHIGTGTFGSIFRPGAFGGETHVGRYTSIAPNVHAVERNHPVDRASTSSVFYDPDCGIVPADNLPAYKPLVIGHDVWIGWGAIILPGCRKIGDGAIIGAGSVVTKDVPEFAIVAGVPGRVLRYRFDETVCGQLKETQWWELTPQQLKSVVDNFLEGISTENVSLFVAAINAVRNGPA